MLARRRSVRGTEESTEKSLNVKLPGCSVHRVAPEGQGVQQSLVRLLAPKALMCLRLDFIY